MNACSKPPLDARFPERSCIGVANFGLRVSCCVLLAAASASAVEPSSTSPPLGCQIGAEIPYFYVREVTTERPNLATCLVCRYGSPPVVMLCVCKLDPQ